MLSPIFSSRLYSHVEGHEPAVLIIKSVDEEVTREPVYTVCVYVLI